MFNKYYQDELAYFRELGREFAAANPEGAHFLGEASRDPDVERLVEGFAFLTGRLKQKLEDELPEFTHAVVETFFPHYLRPIPSMTVVQFEPQAQAAKEVRTVPRGTPLESVPVDGTACRFRTCYETPLVPVILESATVRADSPPQIKMKFKLPEGLALRKVPIAALRFHLTGDSVVTRSIYVSLCRYLRRITAQATAGAPPGAPKVLSQARVVPLGFAPQDALLPFPSGSFPAFRLLHEYFSFPSKFMFVDLVGLEPLASLGEATAFELVFELTQLPDPMPPINAGNLLLNCAPAINLFRQDADPIRVDQTRVDYRVRPQGKDPAHYEIYTIDKVAGLAKGLAKPVEYHPLFHFARPTGPDTRYFRHRVEPALTGDGSEVLVGVLLPASLDDVAEVETLSLELTCTNRNLPTRLQPGQLSVPTNGTPTFVKFRNLTRPTATIPAPTGDDLHWRFLSHLTLNYRSLVDLEALRAILRLYHFGSRVDRQADQTLRLLLEGLQKITSTPATRLVDGAPVRGISVELEVNEDNLGSEGEAFLFGTLLNEFFSQYVSLNAFSRLTLKALKRGEVYTWPARIGQRIIL
jgi:type VI secretion system protein ImpG